MGRNAFLFIVETALILLLVALAIYQFRHREPIMVKIGLSHFFNPSMVSVVAYSLITSYLVTAALLFLFKSPWLMILPLLIFGFYCIYNLSLYRKTNSDCGCANIFFDVSLKLQVKVAAGLMLLTLLLMYARFREKRASSVTV